jgi:endonuclease/exonuclease/phosphatase family metal-dependent hydrolase
VPSSRTWRERAWPLAAALALAGCDLVRDRPGDVDARVADPVDADLGTVDGEPWMRPDARPDAAFDARPGEGPDGYPLPRTDVVPPFGTADTLDLATWNVRNLGTTELGQELTDVALVADLLASLDLDVIAVEEIASIAAWDELVARLPEHEGVLSDHTYSNGEYQKIGFLYRAPAVQIDDVDLLTNLRDASGTPFARPPLQVRFTHRDGRHAAITFDMIGVHLEAGRAESDIDKRTRSVPLLASHIQRQIARGDEDEIVLLGDFNEVLDNSAGRAILAPLIDAGNTFRTEAPADRGEYSHASERLIDHVVTSAGLAAELASREAVIRRVDRDVAGFDATVSDHLPVMLQIPLQALRP